MSQDMMPPKGSWLHDQLMNKLDEPQGPTILEHSRERLRFVIQGKPLGAPRMTRRDRWAKRGVVVKYMDWRNSLEAIRKKLPDAKFVKSLSWVAYFEPPTTIEKRKLTKQERLELLGEAHRAKPDRDNIDKALLDGLFPQDDKAISAGGVCKLWGSPARTEVEIVFV